MDYMDEHTALNLLDDLWETTIGKEFTKLFFPARFVVDLWEGSGFYWDSYDGKGRREIKITENKFMELIEKSVEQKKNLFLDYLDENT